MSESKLTILPNGNREWRNEAGHLHREDGPALDISGEKSWYLYGIEYTEEEYLRLQAVKNNKKIQSSEFSMALRRVAGRVDTAAMGVEGLERLLKKGRNPFDLRLDVDTLEKNLKMALESLEGAKKLIKP